MSQPSASLAVISKKTIKPYRMKEAREQVKLMTNPNGSWDHTGLGLSNGWITVSAGWLLEPKKFDDAHPNYCIFSKMQPYLFVNLGIELVEAWLYTPTVSPFFATKEDRDLFRCFVDPADIYEIWLP